MYMKKRRILLLLLLFSLTGCGRDLYKMPKEVEITLNENQFKVFSDVKIKDLIASSNVELQNGNDEIVNDKIGEHTVTLDYQYKRKKYKFDITYKMVDKTAPIFLSVPGNKTVIKEDDFYPCELPVFIDDYDSVPTCEIEGEYDLTKVGVYQVKYVIKDSSQNTVKRDLRINVVDHISTNKGSSSNTNTTNTPTPKDKIEDVIAKYKTDETMIGIDVSRYQGDIDYEQVRNAGVEFVMMRIGVQSGVNKNMEMDTFFLKNIENAKNAGLKIGVYVYSTATTDEKAREHAKWVVENLKGAKLDFPIAYDWENWKYLMEYKTSIHRMNENFKAFATELKKYDYEAFLYSSKYYLENIWQTHEYPVWLAHYTSETTYKGNYTMWQFSNRGKVPGIEGDVDLNVYYKNKVQ